VNWGLGGLGLRAAEIPDRAVAIVQIAAVGRRDYLDEQARPMGAADVCANSCGGVARRDCEEDSRGIRHTATMRNTVATSCLFLGKLVASKFLEKMLS